MSIIVQINLVDSKKQKLDSIFVVVVVVMVGSGGLYFNLYSISARTARVEFYVMNITPACWATALNIHINQMK